MRRRVKKDHTKVVDEILDGLKAQTVTVPGSAAAEVVIPHLAGNIKTLLEQRATIAKQVEGLLEDFPLS